MLNDPGLLNRLYAETEAKLKGIPVSRPANWGGLEIQPIRIEFMEFSTDRFHKRILYQKVGMRWVKDLLQP